MKKLLITPLLLLLSVSVFSQDFFHSNFDREKNYVILLNPTVSNIKTIIFLLDNHILKVDPDKADFVGIWHKDQEYDFTQSEKFIDENGLEGFHLHEVKGELPEDAVFRQNECTGDFRTIFESSVGAIFFGGQDIPPALYGEENLYSVTTDPYRHFFEVSFLFHLLGGKADPSFLPFVNENPFYMVTGFCLGMQSMNVATGGSLYQDIPAQVYNSHSVEETLNISRENLHRNYWQEISRDPDLMGINIHRIHFTDNSFFPAVIRADIKSEPQVYSSHHQAVKDLGKGLSVTALSADGKIVEGLCHNLFPNVFAVQFHPEVSALYENRSEVKFAPEDEAVTLHRMMDRKSLRFHRKYWSHISEVISENCDRRTKVKETGR